MADLNLEVIESEEPIKRKKKQKPAAKAALVLLVLALAVFAVEFVYMIYAAIHIAATDLIPVKYLVVVAILIVVVSAIHMLLILTKKKEILKRVISLLLSSIVIMISWYGSSIVKNVHTSIEEIVLPEQEVEVQPVKVEEIKKDPFMIYLSGLDTRGDDEIAEKGLSDVNMVIAVNPTTHKILMVTVPRDCYVPLYGDEDKMDKLTHAGSRGVSCSMETLGAFLDVEFNYYIKVNFHSVVEVVDAVGGVEVNSEKAFSSKHSLSGTTYTFTEGINYLDGDAALAFVRERKSFANGDLQRGKHQQLVIKAILEKAMSPAMLTPAKIETMLQAVTAYTKTNFSSDEIKELVKYQLDKMPSWDIQSMSVLGDGAMKSCYSVSYKDLSVIIPYEDSVEEAKAALKEIMKTE